MKIALAIEHFSVHRGGAESYAVHLARTLVHNGWEVHLLGHSWDRDPESAIFHRIPELPRWVPPSVRMLHFALRHRKLVSDETFDVVLGFGNTVVMNVYQSHGGVHQFSTARKLRAVRNPLLRLAKRSALFFTPKYHTRAWIESAPFKMETRPVIVAISDMVRADMAHFFRIPKDEIRLVYNGIDTRRFGTRLPDGRTEQRNRMGVKREVVFLFMAYDFRKKGVRYLIEAAALLRDRVGSEAFRVAIVGGVPSPALTKQVETKKLEKIVTFHGPTKLPEQFYAACDVFILPTFYDACSLVVFEAMTAGLPAITTVHNGAAGIITDGVDGAVVEDPRDVNEMSRAMERFIDSEFVEKASDAARRTALNYTLEKNHQAMMDIFEEIVS